MFPPEYRRPINCYLFLALAAWQQELATLLRAPSFVGFPGSQGRGVPADTVLPLAFSSATSV